MDILFRAKHKEWNEWVEGDLIQETFGECIQFIKAGCRSIIKVKRETICQYSELTDKNKTGIFDKDIVKDVDSGNIGIVKFGLYNSKHYGFYIEWLGNCHYRKDIYYWTENNLIEVIGNIFDNPELLKGE